MPRPRRGHAVVLAVGRRRHAHATQLTV